MLTYPLGFSQLAAYDGAMEAEIGGRVRELVATHNPPLTQRQVADVVQMTPDAFSRALSGKRAFSAVELVELAKLLGASVHWFVTGERDPAAPMVAGRHEYDQLTKADRPLDWLAVRHLLDGIALSYRQVEGILAPPAQSIPRSATLARAALMDRFGAGFVRQLADNVEVAFGVGVARLREVVGAFAVDIQGRQVVVVESDPNWFRQNWSIAHELGHLVQGDLRSLDEPATAFTRPAESRANAWAAELLLPESELRARNWLTMPAADLADFLWVYGVSTASVANRLSALKLAVSGAIEELLQMPTQAVLRRHRPDTAVTLVDDITGRMEDATDRRFPRSLVAAHQTAVGEGRIHARTLEWMLGAAEGSLSGSESGDDFSDGVDLGALATDLGIAIHDEK